MYNSILIKSVHRLFMCVCVTFMSRRDMHLYLRAGWRNWSQSFCKLQVQSLTRHWNHFGFLISISGVRNVLQSQEGVPDKKKIKIKFFNVSRCFGRFGNFYYLFIFGTIFEKVTAKISEISRIYFFYTFRFVGRQNWGKDSKQGRSPKRGAKPLPQDRRLQGLEWRARSALKF